MSVRSASRGSPAASSIRLALRTSSIVATRRASFVRWVLRWFGRRRLSSAPKPSAISLMPSIMRFQEPPKAESLNHISIPHVNNLPAELIDGKHLGQAVVCAEPGGRHGRRPDRQYRRSRSSAQRRWPRSEPTGHRPVPGWIIDQDPRCALGNPTRFLLTPGQAHDLVGSDVLLTDLSAGAVIADKTPTTGSFSL